MTILVLADKLLKSGTGFKEGKEIQSRASFPRTKSSERKRESSLFEHFWTPAFAGATLMKKSSALS
jgi:hypothetical protein